MTNIQLKNTINTLAKIIDVNDEKKKNYMLNILLCQTLK